jgi:hypothetical protein
MRIVECDDCKRCLLHLDLIRCVEFNEDWIEMQVLDNGRWGDASLLRR